MSDRYININLPPLELKKRYVVYLAAVCLRIRGYTMEYAMYHLTRRKK